MPTRQLSSSPGRPSEPAAELVGGGRYQMLELLGAGGMGEVFRVFDRIAGQHRALKRARLDRKRPDRIVEAFEREYQTLASIDHPRIIQVFDYGIDEHGPFYTMELLEGQDLRKLAPLPIREACGYLRDVATSLALLHARGLIYRDLSPANVRITNDGRCKLLDFGALSPFGTSPVIMGTPPVIAPEVLASEPLDQRVDLYALGALSYWMLTGVHAYPAREIRDLRSHWSRALQAPSTHRPQIPAELDALVVSLLQTDPLARPESAAEVISSLEAIGELPPEPQVESELLAHSFLLRPRFVGRGAELSLLSELGQRSRAGSGTAVCIRGAAGTGRSRLLDELGIAEKLAGALVLRADANVARQLNGVARVCVLRLLEAAPALVESLATKYREALMTLGSDLARRCGVSPIEPVRHSADGAEARAGQSLEALLLEASTHKPIVVLVDDVEYADDASIGMLAALSSRCTDHRVLIVTTERTVPSVPVGLSLKALHGYCRELALAELSHREVLELVRSLFGRAPNAERFAEWLHESTTGAPSYAIELCRQLTSSGTIRYTRGVWTLPVERPDTALPTALGDAMALRVGRLSEAARGLAECLSLHEQPPDHELCRLLVSDADRTAAPALLAELTRSDVLSATDDGFRFSSNALREALLAGMDERRLQHNHRRLGEVLASLPTASDPTLQLQAGWHLMQGDQGVRGADMIAQLAADGVTMLRLASNQHRIGAIVEAALSVYARRRYSLYRRLPLLVALAYAGYCEDRRWAEDYGDRTLDALEDLCGVRTARTLRPWLGRRLSAVAALASAYLRHRMTAREQRPYSFYRLLVQLGGAVTTLTGVAALSLDSQRAAAIAATLEPFSVFPQRATFVGLYQFCRSLEQVGLENQPSACATFEMLIERFQNRRYYPTLREDVRRMYLASLYFARGAFAVFKADGRLALHSADVLDSHGAELSEMIASQLRCLYHVNRGEFAEAEPHREQVELHAARVGSAWQVETWEAPAMILIHNNTLNTVEATRLVHRLEVLGRSLPSMRRYERLATHALMLARGVPGFARSVAQEYYDLEPRSYVGWGATLGYVARGYNQLGEHETAKRVCEETLAQLTDAHRDYVSLFLMLDIELAVADAGLGDSARALAGLDALLARFAECDHPLLQGSLHEARARICWSIGDVAGYTHSLAAVEHHFRSTGAAVLVAKCERLALLGGSRTKSLPAAEPSPSCSRDYASGVEESGTAQTVMETTTGTERK